MSRSPGHENTNNRPVETVLASLEKVLKTYGNEACSELLVTRFDTTQFQLKADLTPSLDLPGYSLHDFLEKCSKAAKVGHNNKRRKKNYNKDAMNVNNNGPNVAATNDRNDQRFNGKPSMADQGASDDDGSVDKNDINNLEYSFTIEIYNLKDNKQALDMIRLDSNYKLMEQVKAIEILKGLDFHLVLNIIQNQMLQLQLTSGEKLAAQGLRHCRNLVTHSEKHPPLDKLQAAAKLLLDAVTLLGNESRSTKLKADLEDCFAVLDHNRITDDLRAELLKAAPKLRLLSRSFHLHDNGMRTVGHTTASLSDQLAKAASDSSQHLLVAGYACSGRTAVLLDLYSHWATANSPLNKRYTLLLPFIDRREVQAFGDRRGLITPVNQDDSRTDADRIQHCLEQWAPTSVKKYGVDSFRKMTEFFKGPKCLALVDDGTWEGPSVETCLRSNSVVNDKDEPITPRQAPRDQVAVLLLLDDETVQEEIVSWDRKYLVYDHLYIQFQDKKSLRCPHSLAVFRRVNSTVASNPQLDMMRALVLEGEAKLPTPPTEEDQKRIKSLAYEHILSDNSDFPLDKLPYLPSYMVGPQEGPFTFKSPYIQDYLAALHVCENVDVAAWKWLRNTPRFQRVFKNVLEIWHSTGSIVAHKKYVKNYLAVLFGLYKFKRIAVVKGNRQTAATHGDWNSVRPASWTLEQENFERADNKPSFRSWSFLEHVYEACDKETELASIVMALLCDFTSWTLEWNKMKKATIKLLSHIFDKLQDYKGPCNVELIKLCGCNSRSELLPDVAKELLLLGHHNFCPQLKVTLYYNQKDPRGSNTEPLLVQLMCALTHLAQCRLRLSCYEGPLALDSSHLNLAKSPSFQHLQEMYVTVYERGTLDRLLPACPPTLRYLSLSVDFKPRSSRLSFSSIPSTAFSAGPALPDGEQHLLLKGCRVRLAVRYYGSFKVLSSFKKIEHIAMLRLHGLFQSDLAKAGRELTAVGELNVEGLYVKYVKVHSPESRTPSGDQQSVGPPWHQALLLNLLRCCFPAARRLCLSRLPPARNTCPSQSQLAQGQQYELLPRFVARITEELPKLQRLIVQDSVVSVSEASAVLAFIQDKLQVRGASKALSLNQTDYDENSSTLRSKSEAAAQGQLTLRRRLNMDAREDIKICKPAGLELMFVGVCDLMPFLGRASPQPTHVASSLESPTGAKLSMAGTPPDDSWYFTQLAEFIPQAYSCDLVHFCYEGQRGCYKRCDLAVSEGEEEEHKCCEDRHGSDLRVMMSATRDLRLHLDLFHLNDAMVAKMSDGVECPLVTLIPSLAAAQYLYIRCKGLTANGFLKLATLLYEEKKRLLNLRVSENDEEDAGECAGVSGGEQLVEEVEVEPFHLTIVSIYDEAAATSPAFTSSKRTMLSDPHTQRKRALELAKYALKEGLEERTYLSYAFLKLLDQPNNTPLLFVKKTHSGKIIW